MMTNKVTVKVLLSLEGDFIHPYPYQSGKLLRKLLQVAKFEIPLPACGDINRLLEIIFHQLNIDEPQVDWAVAYRANHHRSLSVGDVVVIGEQAWAVDFAGWIPTAVAAEDVWYDMGRLAHDGMVFVQEVPE